MAIPTKIQTLVNQLTQELEETRQKANYGLTVLRQILERFPDTAILIQFFAYLSSVLLFVETYKRQIQNTIERISLVNVTTSEIQEAGEDLGAILGQVIETKIKVEDIIKRLELLR